MSGLSRTPGKRVWANPHRGFESRPLRQSFQGLAGIHLLTLSRYDAAKNEARVRANSPANLVRLACEPGYRDPIPRPTSPRRFRHLGLRPVSLTTLNLTPRRVQPPRTDAFQRAVAAHQSLDRAALRPLLRVPVAAALCRHDRTAWRPANALNLRHQHLVALGCAPAWRRCRSVQNPGDSLLWTPTPCHSLPAAIHRGFCVVSQDPRFDTSSK
jgi:hypothetical protein